MMGITALLLLLTGVFIKITIESLRETNRINRECDKVRQEIIDGIEAHKKFIEKMRRERE